MTEPTPSLQDSLRQAALALDNYSPLLLRAADALDAKAGEVSDLRKTLWNVVAGCGVCNGAAFYWAYGYRVECPQCKPWLAVLRKNGADLREPVAVGLTAVPRQ